MEVLSSAEMTYSWADKGFPSQTRLYRSRTLAALAAKFGSLMKIQDWYCQGLIASSASHRRTVDVDTDAAIPSATTCAARSGQLHRDSGTPLASGGWQASALRPAT